MDVENRLLNFFKLIKKFDESLKFQIVEIGANPYGKFNERFHKLLDYFPNSKIYAFDVDKNECEKLNNLCKKGMKFFPFVLGEKKEKRKFYQTNHPMCSSLYEPNEKLIKLYNNFNVAYLKNVIDIETISLDDFLEDQKINTLDFIKIDIQGAELDVFRGAVKCLKSVLMVVSEVEFISHYINQPLFGDVCSFLDKNNLMFHKFVGLAGRTLRPVVLGNDINFASQHIWSDAVFIRNILKVSEIKSSQLLKLAVFSYLYRSLDLTFYCLTLYDKINDTKISELYKKIDFATAPNI